MLKTSMKNYEKNMRVTFERSGENSTINKQSKNMYNEEQCSKPMIFLPFSNFKA